MLFSVRFKSHRCKTLTKLWENKAFYCHSAKYVTNDPKDEYSEVPNYPAIEPVTEEYLKYKEKQHWYDKIKKTKTIEEKLFQINMPRYWGWKCLLLKEGEIPYNSLEFTKFITRTHLIEVDELPNSSPDSSYKCFQLASALRDNVQELITENKCIIRHKHTLQNSDPDSNERELLSGIINGLNRLILKALQMEITNLQNIQIDYFPRLESFWNLGSLTETYIQQKYDEGLKPEEIPEEYLGRPSNKFIQYIGKPIIQLRNENPLAPIMDCGNALYLEYPVPIYKYDPFVVFGYEMVRRHVTNIPGFWPGESREFSFLSYHDTSQNKHRPITYGKEDESETLQCQAILASFAWVMALTSYQGFTTFHDVTYPFVTQSILTDGREFSFAIYQLNTTELHHENPLTNPLCNICWMTPKIPLYEIKDGEVTDINLKVLKRLIQCYMMETEDVKKRIRKPYLEDGLGVVAKYEDEEKRVWLENKFKHFSSNRPRHRVDKMYEPADYEKIYKIQFRQMPRDPLSRPFNLDENPYLRKMSDHVPPYIPRSIRPDKHLPKYKQQKFRKTYYPE